MSTAPATAGRRRRTTFGARPCPAAVPGPAPAARRGSRIPAWGGTGSPRSRPRVPLPGRSGRSRVRRSHPGSNRPGSSAANPARVDAPGDHAAARSCPATARWRPTASHGRGNPDRAGTDAAAPSTDHPLPYRAARKRDDRPPEERWPTAVAPPATTPVRRGLAVPPPPTATDSVGASAVTLRRSCGLLRRPGRNGLQGTADKAQVVLVGAVAGDDGAVAADSMVGIADREVGTTAPDRARTTKRLVPAADVTSRAAPPTRWQSAGAAVRSGGRGP